jgi:hypothetical protein
MVTSPTAPAGMTMAERVPCSTTIGKRSTPRLSLPIRKSVAGLPFASTASPT